MKIGILGSGIVAKTLGTAFLAKGHEVKLGTRDPAKLSEWLEQDGKNGAVGSFADAASFGEVVIVATSGAGAVPAIETAGAANFDGKTLIDVTNPLDFSGGMPPKFDASPGNSNAEKIQRALPNANVVKAFNMISSYVMVDPKFGDQRGTLFIAGESDTTKAETTKLAEELGWEVLDFGGIAQAFYLEAFASGFVNYAFPKNDWLRSIRFLKR